jgi:DNA-binding CsgD family transcriptional regulator
MPCGVALIKNDGTILYASGTARRILRTRSKITNSRIFCGDGTSVAGFDRALRRLFETGASDKPFIVPRGNGELPYVLHLFGATKVTEANDLALPEVATVMIIEPKRTGHMITPEALSIFLDLPNGEARIAAEIARGQSPRQAAATLGLTEGSVRVILKRIYSKQNISRQAELVLLISRLWDCTPKPA